MHRRSWRAAAALAILVLASLHGCGHLDSRATGIAWQDEGCLASFRALDEVTAAAQVRDAGTHAVPGFPFLRVDRLLASFREELHSEPAMQTWIGRLAQLDADARVIERRNLAGAGFDTSALPPGDAIKSCRQSLVGELLSSEAARRALVSSTRVPDDYVTAWRVVGLYPITSQFVASGVRREHARTREVFATPLEMLPVKGQLQRWRSSAATASPKTAMVHDPLGVPTPDTAQLDALFRRHAPTWEVDVADANDLVGTAIWRGGASLDESAATEYRRASYTRFGDQVLLQLNYIVWFRARPGDDMYAGALDGLIWRVTLGPDGRPWLYDSIHNCGCYHVFFPTDALVQRDDLPAFDFEPPLVLAPPPKGPLVLRIASATHYLERVYGDENGTAEPGNTAPVLRLRVADYDMLRAIPGDKGSHSYFGRHGLVAGSERNERFVLWPMGVRSPGAMRQWGRHAVAFVGRRHFDDPRLIESLFRSRE